MASRLPSLENISVVKCAILICLSPELKREILCVPGSEYDVCKSRYIYYRKEHWNSIVERKAKEIIKGRELPENLEHEILNILSAIALRMLIWAEYHEGTLELTRYYSLNFLNFSHFTARGVIDNKKAAEDMIKDENLGIKQKYKLACIYCFTRHISSYFKQIVGDKEDVDFGAGDSKWMEKPEIVKFWTFQLTGAVDVYNNNPRNHSRLQTAIRSGSTEAVKYSWEKAGTLPSEYAHIYTVTEMLKKESEKSDWIVFRDKRFDDSKESWIPNYFYVDILCFFLSSMTDSQQQKALERNITRYETNRMTVLELFLSWPYQDYFMKTAALLWNLIPQKAYAIILLKICDVINPCKGKQLLYGEEKSYDYKKLFGDFWSQSPDHFKRYVFKDYSEDYRTGEKVFTATEILLKLLSLKKFTCEDEEIIRLILGKATNEEKVNLTSAVWWGSACVSILKKEQFEIFDRLLLVLFKTERKIAEFKSELSKLVFRIGAKSICAYFLSYGKLNAIKSLMKRFWVSEERFLVLKNTIFFSFHRVDLCLKLLSRRYEDVEEFINWLLPRKERAIEFKKWLSSLCKDNLPNRYIKPIPALQFVTRFTRSKRPNREVIEELETGVADIFGQAICEDLIAGSSFQVIYDERDSSVKAENEFRGGQWIKVDDFLTACLSSKDKILEFKKTLYELAGYDIHFKLVKAKKWKEAKRFFDWLGLSEEEIKYLKEISIFDTNQSSIDIRARTCWSLLHYLVFDHDGGMHNLEDADLLLRWHLTDKETVIKFRDYFFGYHKDFDEYGLKKFNSLIENYLDYLDQEEICQTCRNAEERFFRYLDGGGRKRKSSVFSEQKKLRLTTNGEETKEGGNSSRPASQTM